MRLSAVIAVGFVAVAFAPVGRAATVTALMPVTATVDGSCTVSANPLAFGSYSGTAPSMNAAVSRNANFAWRDGK